MKIIQEFKDFAIKGNAIDLAVGVIIGASFGSVVNSIVKDLMNPLLGLLTGEIDFSEKVIVLKKATDTMEAITLNWGSFISVLLNFFIVAFAIFIVVKQMNKFKKQKEKKDKKTSGPSEVELLTEIRDLLKK